MSDAGNYPVVYRMSTRGQVSHYLFAGFLLGVAITILANVVPPDGGQFGPLNERILFFVTLGLGSAFVFLRAFTYRLILQADSIAAGYIFDRRSLLLSEMTGYRHRSARHAGVLEFVPQDRNALPLELNGEVKIDSSFAGWLQGLTELSAMERLGYRKEVEEDKRLGATPDQRWRALERGRRLALGGNLLAVVAIALSWIHPLPHRLEIVVLACMPLSVILLICLDRGMYCLNASKLSWRPRLKWMLWAPSVALAIHAAKEVTLVDAHDGWLMALAGAALFAVLFHIARGGMSNRYQDIWFYSLIMTGWGFGTGILLNAAFDVAPPQTYQAMITSTGITPVKYNRKPFAILGSWGPVDDGQRVDIDWDTYRSRPYGGYKCAVLHWGVLSVPWYTIGECKMMLP